MAFNPFTHYKRRRTALSDVRDRDMRIVLDEIANEMTPDQLAQARKEISEFQTSLHNRPPIVITDGRAGDWGE
jgi:hypothetical protein